jgi:hypothetical protein
MKNKDWMFGSQISHFMKPNNVYVFIVIILISTELFAIGSLAYLGSFNRYLADDYCESVSTRNETVISAVIHRYLNGEIRSSNRYTNLLFVGLAEKLGPNNLQIIPSLMIFFWLVGFIWLVHELRKLAGIRWPIIMDYLLAITVIFFAVWQAPNRFQIFFWRSSMATHFAPLVFMSLLFGFIVSQINSDRKPSLWIFLLVFTASFMIGGFSEPPVTFMITITIMLILVAWQWENNLKRRSVLNLLSFSLAGALLAFIVMFFSPGNISHGNTSLTDLFMYFKQTIRFTFNFLDDTIRTLPSPSVISILTAFFILFTFSINSEALPVGLNRKRQIVKWLVLVPILQFLLIAVSFAPSAYGQSYPAERAQFLGRLIMTTAFLIEGALLGILFARSRMVISRQQVFFLLSSFLFFILAFYPLRAGLALIAEFPDYQQWASKWDLRESEIYNSISMGEQDLVVRWLPTRDGVKEIDADTRHWVNRCAAEYYEVDSIRSNK